MALAQLTFTVLILFILSATAPRGCDAKVLGRGRHIPRQRPNPEQNVDDTDNAPPDDSDEPEPEYIADGSCVRVKVHDDSEHERPGPPSYSCYHYGYGYSRYHGYGYGYHHSPVETAAVATCTAFLELREQVQNLTLSFNNSYTELFSEVDRLNMRVTVLENELSELNGEGMSLIRIFLTIRGITKRVCNINSEIEAAQLCKLLGNRLADPYFIHLPCTDFAVERAGDRCYEAPDYTYLEPLCYASINQPDFKRCFTEPDPEQRCEKLVYLSCNGYTEGRLSEIITFNLV